MAELSTIARPYAEALFSVAQGTGESLEGWRTAVDELANLMSHPQVADVVADPNLDHAQVFGLLTGMMKGTVPAAGINFLKLLIEKHRMPAVFRVRRTFDELWQHENKLLPVEITSAIELDKKTVKQIGDRIGEETGQKIELSEHVDPDILGGLIVRVGNSIIDSSIRARLHSLRKQVAKA